jgi:hypothetical protein
MASPLDRFAPAFDAREQFQVRVRAPADLTYTTAAEFDMDALPLVHAIFRARALLMRAGPAPTRPFNSGLLTGASSLGWGTLVEEPGRLFVAGAYCQPWHGQVTFHPLTPETFAPFAEPGYVKIAWTLETEPEGPDSCLLKTETRVVATDSQARSRFLPYWRWARFGIFTIRWLLLPAVRRQAEGRARSSARPAV